MQAFMSVIDLSPPTIGSVHFSNPFPTRFNLVGKGSGHAQITQDMAERQSPDRKKRPWGTPTFLTPVRTKSASS